MPDIPDAKRHAHPHTSAGQSRKREGKKTTSKLPGVATSPYAELAVTSNFTFLTGASHPDEYVYQAAALRYGAIAVTDRNSLAGVVRAHVAAKDAKVPFIVGCRLELSENAETKSPKTKKSKSPNTATSFSSNEDESLVSEGFSVLVYPTSRAAYGRLCRLLTLGKRRTKKGECLLTLDDLLEYQEGLLAVVLLSEHNHIICPLPDGRGSVSTEEPARITSPGRHGVTSSDHHISTWPQNHIATSLGLLRAAFDDDRLSLAIYRLYGHGDEKRNALIEALSGEFAIPLVAVNDVHYHVPARRALQDVMTCVRHHCTLAEAGFRLFPNGERYLKEPQEMARLFADHPEAIARTMEIAERAGCFTKVQGSSHGGRASFKVQKERPVRPNENSPAFQRWDFEAQEAQVPEGRLNASIVPTGLDHFSIPDPAINRWAIFDASLRDAPVLKQEDKGFSLDQLRYEYPHETCPVGRTPMEHLIELTWQGAAERYPTGVPDKVRRQIEHEFSLIEELQYAPYFLTVHDLVQFARSRGILCQGRGAAANSAVCFCLGVTAVDPDRINLLFERFVSRERDEPPDIDIDFEHERREEVIQYIYEKYGRDRAGLTAEVITYRRRSAVRDVGKALGLSLDAVDRIAKRVDHWELNPFADAEAGDVQAQLAALGFDPADATVRHLITLVDQIAGFPRHLSQHVGGFVMTEGLLCESVPIENAAMKDRTVIEWDKDDIEALGMLKVDVLGLGMLTCIRKALDFINRHGGTEARRHEGYGLRYEGTKASREREPKKKEEIDHGNQNVQRFDCVAEGDGVGQDDLRSHTDDARYGTIRPDHANETKCGVCPEQHSGRLCQAKPNRLCPLSKSSPGFTGGTGDPTHTVRTNGLPQITETCERSPSGDRSCTPRFDSKPGEITSKHEVASCLDPAPSCLGGSRLGRPRSVPSCLTLATIPPEDPVVYDMMCKADTVGVFQIESRAQMTMLPRLRPRCFYDLVIEVAIVRPGPIIGDMVHPYLRRRNGEEKFSYPTPVIEEVLGKTLGVPLFQEQVMSLAIRAAGFTAGEAERLRRAITAWTSKDDIAKYPARFIEGMLRNGYDISFATWCFERMKGFSQYGFPESHAASFALLVYASAWLKCYHPAAFAAALLNSQPMGFYAPAQIIRDAQDHGVAVLPADVNDSEWDCTLGEEGTEGMGKGTQARSEGDHDGDPEGVTESSRGLSEATPPDQRHNSVSTLKGSQTSLRLGLRILRGLREADAKKIVETVREHGPFATPFALWQKSGVFASTLHSLAMGDAFQSMGLDRQHALWEIQQLHGKALPLFDRHEGTEARRHGGNAITQLPNYQIIKSDQVLPEIPNSHQVAADYRIIGFSLKDHPLSFLRETLAERGVITAAEAKDESKSPFGRRVTVAGLVLFRQRPGTARGVMFMTLEDETGRVDLIVRPGVYEKFRDAAVYSKLALARGRVERQNGVVHVLATAFESLDYLATGLPTQSRDFR